MEPLRRNQLQGSTLDWFFIIVVTTAKVTMVPLSIINRNYLKINYTRRRFAMRITSNHFEVNTTVHGKLDYPEFNTSSFHS